MATSLINDSGYVINISRKLAEASQVVLRDRTYDLVMSARAGDVGDADSGVASEDNVAGVEVRDQSAV